MNGKKYTTKKCKNCQEKFTPYNSLQKYCSKPECISVWVNTEKQKQWNKRKSEMKKDLMSLQDYIKIAQTHFNHFIRLRDSGNDCISCGKKISNTETVHASHYKPAGTCYNVRFNEDNVWVSCVKCNTHLSGNISEYRTRLVNKIGSERVEEVERLSSITRKFTKEELIEIADVYKKKVKELKNN